VLLLSERGLAGLEEREEVFNLAFIDLKLAAAAYKLKNGS
jgi:hypothetical protein